MNLDFAKLPTWHKIATAIIILGTILLNGLAFSYYDSGVPLSELGEYGKIDYGYRALPTVTTIVIVAILTIWNVITPIKEGIDTKNGKVVIIENGISSAVDHNFTAWLYIDVTLFTIAIASFLKDNSYFVVELFGIAYSIAIRWGIFDIIMNLSRGLKWDYISETSAGEDAKMSTVLWFMKNSKKDIPRSNVIAILVSILLVVLALIIK